MKLKLYFKYLLLFVFLLGCVDNVDTNKFSVIPRANWDVSSIEKREDISIQANQLNSIVIHHSAFIQKPGPSEIQEYEIHKMGYDEIAYHFIITENGDVYEGRSIGIMGAHAGQTKEANELADSIRRGLSNKPIIEALQKDPDFGSIGICLDGNFEFDEPSSKQIESLSQLLKVLIVKYKIRKSRILLHKDVREILIEKNGLTPIGVATVCPGKYSYASIKIIINSL